VCVCVCVCVNGCWWCLECVCDVGVYVRVYEFMWCEVCVCMCEVRVFVL